MYRNGLSRVSISRIRSLSMPARSQLPISLSIRTRFYLVSIRLLDLIKRLTLSANFFHHMTACLLSASSDILSGEFILLRGFCLSEKNRGELLDLSELIFLITFTGFRTGYKSLTWRRKFLAVISCHFHESRISLFRWIIRKLTILKMIFDSCNCYYSTAATII